MESKKRFIPILKNTLFFLLGAALLYLVFKDQDPALIWQELKAAKFGYLGISMVSGYLAIISRGIRWNLLLQPAGYNPKLWNSVHSVNVGYFVNIAIPRAGEISRCTALNRIENIPVNKLIGTVVVERVIDLIMLASLMALSFVLSYDELYTFFTSAMNSTKGSEPDYTWLYVILGIGLLGLLFLFLLWKKIKQLRIFQKILDLLKGIKEGFTTIFHLKKKGLFIFHTLFIWFNYFFMSYICFMAFEETSHLSLSDGLFIMIVGGLGMVAPAPGGLGAYHAAVIAGLTLLLISPDVCRTFAISIHASQTLMMILSGSLALIFLSLAKSKKKNAATS